MEMNANSSLLPRGSAALAMYLILNVVLTYSNKALLQNNIDPYLLSALHAFASWLGCTALLKTASVESRKHRFERFDCVVLVLFSVLYTLNIGISNVSIHLTPLPLQQLLRAPTPVMTAALLGLSDSTIRYSRSSMLFLTLIVLGVILATLTGDTSSYTASKTAVSLTILGAVLASLKSIATSWLQRPRLCYETTSWADKLGLGMNAIELLQCITPLAFLQALILARFSGDLHRLSTPPTPTQPESGARYPLGHLTALLLLNCVVAFALNIASFEASRRAGPLGITVAGNLKQVLVVVEHAHRAGQRGLVAFGLWKVLGVNATVIGSILFSLEEEKRKRVQQILLERKWRGSV